MQLNLGLQWESLMSFWFIRTLDYDGFSYLLSKHVKSVPLKLLITVIICTVTVTWSVALELYYVSKLTILANIFHQQSVNLVQC